MKKGAYSFIGYTVITISGIWLFCAVTVLFIPDQLIRRIIEVSGEKQGLTISAKSVSTGFPFVVKVNSLAVGDATGIWLVADKLQLRLRVLPILVGRGEISLSGSIAQGSTVQGTIGISNGSTTEIRVNNLPLQSIPYLALSTHGGQFSGVIQSLVIKGNYGQRGLIGECKTRVLPLIMQNASIGSLPLPTLEFDEARLLAKLENQRIHLTSIALESPKIYVRLTGSAPLQAQGQLKVQFEMMPKADFLTEQQTVFALLTPYQLTTGHYSLPITGPPSAPRIGQ